MYHFAKWTHAAPILFRMRSESVRYYFAALLRTNAILPVRLKPGPRWLLQSLLLAFFLVAADAVASAYISHYYVIPQRQMRTHGYAVSIYDSRGQGTSEARPVTWGWFESRDLLGAMNPQ